MNDLKLLECYITTGAFTRRGSVYLIYQNKRTVGAEFEVAGVVATGAFTRRAYLYLVITSPRHCGG